MGRGQADEGVSARPSRTKRKPVRYDDGDSDDDFQEEDSEPESPPAKRARSQPKLKDAKEPKPPKAPKSPKAPPPPKPEPEKRVDKHGGTVMYRGSCSQATKDRIDRALSVGAGGGMHWHALHVCQCVHA